jgi:restriction endonuclease S subunit
LKQPLTNLAELQSGIYANPERTGDVLYLQARHFNSDGKVDPGYGPDLPLAGKIGKHLLKADDILLAAKGHRNFAVKYRSEIGPAVASSVFTIIRIRQPDAVLPDYLLWFLNQAQAQAYFQSESRGSSLPSLNQKSVESVQVPVPPVSKQRAIVAFAELAKREKALRQKLEDLRENRNQQLILQSIR